MKKANVLRNLFLLAVLFNSIHTHSQVIFTKAGTNNPGDYCAATSASLSGPVSVISDRNGNLYIADYTNHRIRKIDTATGIISTVAGTGVQGFSGDGALAANAQLRYPNSLAIDGTGNLIICDNGNRRIRKVDAVTGMISTIAGNRFFRIHW